MLIRYYYYYYNIIANRSASFLSVEKFRVRVQLNVWNPSSDCKESIYKIFLLARISALAPLKNHRYAHRKILCV